MTAGRGRSLVKAAGVVSGALIVSRVLGYVREALLAARFGATHTTDAFLVAEDIPGAVLAALSTALVMVVIPVYQSTVRQRGEAAGRRLISSVLNAAMLVAVGLVALGWLVAPKAVPLAVAGLPAGARDLTVSLTRTMLPMMFFLAIAGVLSAVLNANRHFTAPALAGFVSNVAIITGLVLVTGPDQVHWVAWAVVIGAALTVVIQLPWLRGVGYRYEPVLDWHDPGLRQVVQLILPVVVTSYAVQLQNLVNRFLASHLAEGSISALDYALRVNALPYGVVGAAISTVIYPNLAELVAAGDREQLGQTVVRGLRTLSFVLLPMALGLIIFREQIVQLIYQRGAFDPRATAATAYALQFYAAGILFFGWLDYINRCFFALQDAVTPMAACVGMVLLNVGLNLALMEPLAHGGLALGTSLATAVTVGYLLWRLGRRLGALRGLPLLRAVGLHAVTAMAGAVAGYITYMGAGRLAGGMGLVPQAFRLGVGLGTVMLVHLVLAAWLGSEEMTEVRAGLSRKLHRARI